MADFRRPSPDEMSEIRKAFASEDAARELLDQAAPVRRLKSTAMLFRDVRDGKMDWSSLSAGARQAVRQMDSMTATTELDLAVAAASDGPIERRAPGCTITFTPSKADPDRTYIVIRRENGADTGYTRLIIHLGEDERVEIALPAMRRHIQQVLIDNASAEYRMLCDPSARLFFR
jgi:hypothetical protein